VILFFGIGVAIALVIACRLLDRGSSMSGAIAFGACFGGYGAWFVFCIAFHAIKRVKELWRSAKMRY